MASALWLLPLVLMSLVVLVTAAKSPGRPLFREYIGAEGTNVTFADVPVHPGVDFHFILSFAIDYDASYAPPRPTDGRFALFWNEALITPAAVAAAKRRCGSNVRVALSLGGDTVGTGTNATFRVLSSVDAWVSNATSSLTDIVARYGLDGVDVDYEHFGTRETPEVFAECVGRLVRWLKATGTISFASIAPFANPDVQAHYGELWRRYDREFEYVNFQFYAYAANTTVAKFLGYYDEQSRLYNDDAAGGGCAGDGKKVLVGFGTDPASGGLKPGKGFFRACRALRRQGRLHGVFVWAADNSAQDGFRYERRAQRFLAGAAPGFT
jgi:hypothetical protein